MAAADMIFREASLSDRQQLIDLWGNVFEDEEAVSSRLQNEFAGSGNVYVADEGGRIAAQLLAVPCTADRRKGTYLYALATDPYYRGQGVMGHLMEYVKKQVTKAGSSFFVLIPASRSLFDYYETHGFENIYMLKKKLDIDYVSEDNFTSGQIPASIFMKQRSMYLSRGTVCFNESRTVLELEEQWYYGCSSVYCEKGYAIYMKVDNKLFITEIACESKDLADRLVRYAAKLTNCKKVRITLPTDSNLFCDVSDSNEKTSQAQFKWWGCGLPPEFYIRFAMDDLPVRIQTNNSDAIV